MCGCGAFVTQEQGDNFEGNPRLEHGHSCGMSKHMWSHVLCLKSPAGLSSLTYGEAQPIGGTIMTER